ncbi:MAG: hypothetical protein WBQ21_12935 [Solirubrobacteraceae bacterium]
MSHEQKDIEAQLAALADGTLPPSEREQVLRRIEQSPELAVELERQRRAVGILTSIQDVQAPAALHSSIQSLAASARPRRRRAAVSLRLAGAGALAAAAVAAFIIALIAGTTGEPTVQQAASLALRPATLASPAESSRDRGVLDSNVEGIAYPYWQGNFGWQAAGARVDRLAGRTITTVFYTHNGTTHTGPGRIGYAIVAGHPLTLPRGTVRTLRGISFRVLTSEGATVVTWRQAGHTCILVARGVPSSTLVHLAAWE